MNRRMFLIGTGVAAFAPPAYAVAQNQTPDALETSVAELERELSTLRAAGKPIPSGRIASRLETGLTDRDRRVAAFRIIQNIPYRLTAWTGDPDSLFANGRGDCRHKSAALLRLMRAWRFDARPIQLVFDWADLPIPKAVLAPLAETRGFHDTVEVRINGKMTLVDPTWDPVLGKAGFPFLANWDGIEPTPAIAPRANVAIRQGDFKAGTDLYAHFGIRWPERSRTLAFNRAFNAWTDQLRAGENSVKG